MTYHDLVALVAGQIAAQLAPHYPAPRDHAVVAERAVALARDVVDRALRVKL